VKTVNVKVILQIYLSQGLSNVYEFLNRIEYEQIDEYSKNLMAKRKDIDKVEAYLKKLIENG